MVLVLCEMQSISSRIWTRVAVSISYDDNHYIMGTSTNSQRYCLRVYTNNFKERKVSNYSHSNYGQIVW